MIQNKTDLKYYIAQDLATFAKELGTDNSFMGGVKRWFKVNYNKLIYFHIVLRKYEYYINVDNGVWGRFMKLYYRYKFSKLRYLLGISISPNCFGPGLRIAHFGSIVVYSGARIGKNCVLHTSTNIGYKNGAPIIGDNVYIGPGAKIFGPITIANGVKIGANAVVNKSILEENVSVAGVPAKIVKRN